MPASQLLTELLQRGALETQPRNFYFLSDVDFGAFEELRAKGLATLLDSTSGRAAATQRAASALAILQLFEGPAPVYSYMSSARLEGNVAEASVFDLLLMLVHNGWTEQAVAGKSRRCLPFAPRGQKVFFLDRSARHISRFYLICLLKADDLFAKGVTAIAHFQTDAYYKALMDCEAAQAKLIQPDCKAAEYKRLKGGKPLSERPEDDAGLGNDVLCC